MAETAGAQEIKDTLETFFRALDARDENTLHRLWHPDAKLFINATDLAVRPLSFLLGIPAHVRCELQAISQVDIHELIATARADYRLAAGIHSGFFNLVKVDGCWLVANWVDHGLEPPPA